MGIGNTERNMRDPGAIEGLLGVLMQAADEGGAEGSNRAYSNFIIDQEAAGQEQVVASDLLPTECSPDDAAYEALGFTFGAAVPGDPLFRHATLPSGWKRVPAEGNLYTNVVDELGRARASIGYKAAFYDRWASMRLLRPADYVRDCVDSGTEPVWDDWCGPVHAVELAQREVQDGQKQLAFWKERCQDEEQFESHAPYHREQVAKWSAVLEKYLPLVREDGSEGAGTQ